MGGGCETFSKQVEHFFKRIVGLETFCQWMVGSKPFSEVGIRSITFMTEINLVELFGLLGLRKLLNFANNCLRRNIYSRFATYKGDQKNSKMKDYLGGQVFSKDFLGGKITRINFE